MRLLYTFLQFGAMCSTPAAASHLSLPAGLVGGQDTGHTAMDIAQSIPVMGVPDCSSIQPEDRDWVQSCLAAAEVVIQAPDAVQKVGLLDSMAIKAKTTPEMASRLHTEHYLPLCALKDSFVCAGKQTSKEERAVNKAKLGFATATAFLNHVAERMGVTTKTLRTRLDATYFYYFMFTQPKEKRLNKFLGVEAAAEMWRKACNKQGDPACALDSLRQQEQSGQQLSLTAVKRLSADPAPGPIVEDVTSGAPLLLEAAADTPAVDRCWTQDGIGAASMHADSARGSETVGESGSAATVPGAFMADVKGSADAGPCPPQQQQGAAVTQDKFQQVCTLADLLKGELAARDDEIELLKQQLWRLRIERALNITDEEVDAAMEAMEREERNELLLRTCPCCN